MNHFDPKEDDLLKDSNHVLMVDTERSLHSGLVVETVA